MRQETGSRAYANMSGCESNRLPMRSNRHETHVQLFSRDRQPIDPTCKDSRVPQNAVVPALPSVDVAEELVVIEPTQRRGILTIVTWCFLSTLRLRGSLETTVGSFMERLRRLIPTSRDELHRPHFRSPPLITDLPGVLIRHASSDAERQAWGPCCQLRCYKSRPTSSSAQKIFRIWYLSARALRTSVRIRPRLRFC